MIKLKGILFAAIMLFTVTAWAGEKMSQDVKVDYSADKFMETEDMTMQSRVFHSSGKQREEQDMGGMKQTMITRMDKKVMWILMPDQKMYMEMKLDGGNPQQSDPSDLSDYKVEHSVLGEEVVNGVNTTKSKIVMTDSQGHKFDGLMWNTKDGIMVKIDTTAKAEGRKMRMKMELKNLKMEKQDAQLFEVPAGYKKMSMPGMGGGFNMKDMMQGGE